MQCISGDIDDRRKEAQAMLERAKELQRQVGEETGSSNCGSKESESLKSNNAERISKWNVPLSTDNSSESTDGYCLEIYIGCEEARILDGATMGFQWEVP